MTERALPDARDALRELGGEPSISSTDWTAAATIVINGVPWTVSVTAQDKRSTANWYQQ